MSLASIVAFASFAALLVAAPGPDWAFTLGVVARRSSLAAAVSGLVLGYVTMTIVVATGFGLLVARSEPLTVGLHFAGACYLLWLGVRILRAPSPGPSLTTGTSSSGQSGSLGDRRATLLAGVGVSALNPKALLLFLALLPQFTDPETGWPLAVQLGVLGLVFTALVAAFYPVLGTLARSVLQRSTNAALALSRCAGVTMLLLGVALLVDLAAA